MTEPTPFFALVQRAARLCARRWAFYLLCAIVACGAQIGIELTHVLQPLVLIVVGQIFTLPAIAAIVYGFANADDTGGPIDVTAVWERIGERFWAVFVIDALSSLVNLADNPGSASLLLSMLFLTGTLILTALLIYADVYAVIEPGLSATTIVQQSILTSVRTAMTRVGYQRAIILVFIQLALGWLASILDGVVGKHIVDVPSIASTTILSLLAVPLAALTLVVFLDLRRGN